MKQFFKKHALSIDIIGVATALAAHVWYLFHTTFVDWPEMMIYPYFSSRGLLYYRDISVPFPPLINYFLSFCYRFLGFSPAAERIIAYFLILLTDILVYVAVRSVTKQRFAAWASLLFFVFWQPIFYGNTLWHEIVIAPVMLLAFLAVERYRRVHSYSAMLWLGAALTALTLMKQTVLWPIAVVYAYLYVSSKAKRQTLAHLVWIGMMILTAHALVWAYYAMQGAGYQYVFWVYQFPLSLTGASTFYKIPVSKSDLALILPAFLPILVYPVFRKYTVSYFLLVPWTVALFVMALPRWGIFRLEPALTFAAIGFGLFMSSVWTLQHRIARGVWIGVLIVVLGFGWRSLRVYTTLRDPMQPQFFDATYERLLGFAVEHIHGPMYILGNYDYLYFGLHTVPTVKPWIPMFPWNGQIPDAQESVIRSLVSTKVPYILYIPYHGTAGFYDSYFPEHIVAFMKSRYTPVSSLPVPGGILYQLTIQ